MSRYDLAMTDSTTIRKDPYHHGDLANALLDAVDELVRENGVGAVSLRGAARRAGVSHSAPAHHFGDKDGLLAAFAEQGFTYLANAMTSAVSAAHNESDLDQIQAMGKAYVMFAVTYPAHFDIMWRSGLDKTAHPNLLAAANATTRVLEAKTTDLVTSGGFPGVDHRDLAAFLWAIAHGLASLWVDGSLGKVFDEDDLNQLIDGALRAPFWYVGEPPASRDARR